MRYPAVVHHSGVPTITVRSTSDAPTRPPAELRTPSRRTLSLLLVGFGAGLALIAAVAGAPPAWVMLPFSAALLAAAVILPFPEADYYLAFLVGATLPTMPPTGLPNLPLAIPVLVVALVRVAPAYRQVPRRAVFLLIGLWAILAVGMLVSSWPGVQFWLRPTALVAVAALASAVGLLVAVDRARMLRWLLGFGAFAGAVAVTALAFYATQFVVSIQPLVSFLASAQGYVRGDAAADFFTGINNWVIWSPAGGIVRAVSLFVPAPHGVGAILGLTMPMLAGLVVVDHNVTRRHRWLWLTVLALGTATLALTLSRATWLAALVAGGVATVALIAFMRDRPILRRAAMLAGVAVLLCGLSAVTVFAAGQAAAGVGDRLTEADADQSVTDRVRNGQQAIAALATNPWRGYGLGGWSVGEPDRIGAAYVHNLYLEYARALGVSGLLWVVAIPALLVGGGLFVLRRGGADRFLGLGLTTVGAFAAVHFLFDDSLLVPQYAWMLLWTVGAAIAVMMTAPREVTDRE